MDIRDIVATACCIACLVVGLITGSIITEARILSEIEDVIAQIEMEERE